MSNERNLNNEAKETGKSSIGIFYDKYFVSKIPWHS